MIIVRSSSENIISLPHALMAILNLNEGEEIKTIIDGATLRLARLDRFLALRGILREDESFDSAMKYIDKAWQSRFMNFLLRHRRLSAAKCLM